MFNINDEQNALDKNALSTIQSLYPKNFPTYKNLSKLVVNPLLQNDNASSYLSPQLTNAVTDDSIMLFNDSNIIDNTQEHVKVSINTNFSTPAESNTLFSSMHQLACNNKITINCDQENEKIILWLVFDFSLADQLVGYEFDINVSPGTHVILKKIDIYNQESKGIINRRYNIRVHPNAVAELVEISTLSAGMDNYIELNIEQLHSSSTFLKSFDAGAQITQKTLNVNLVGDLAKFNFEGIIYTKNKEIAEQIVKANHLASNTSSNQNHRILSGGESKGRFHSTIHTVQDIKNIDAHQLSKNLLLSKKASITTYPILEINTDDIQCSHGATIGMLNPEHILYLRSRGIPEQEAAKILIEGMISEFFNKEEFNFERDIIDSWVKHS